MVFTQEDGSWLHPGKVTDLFERLVAASGLPSIRLHDLRHGAATLMLAAGIDVKIVSDTLGHSDTRITRDIYQSVLPQAGKNAAEATRQAGPASAEDRGGGGRPQGRQEGDGKGESRGQGQEESQAEEAQEVGHRTAPLTHRSRKPPHGIPAV